LNVCIILEHFTDNGSLRLFQRCERCRLRIAAYQVIFKEELSFYYAHHALIKKFAAVFRNGAIYEINALNFARNIVILSMGKCLRAFS